MKSLSLPEQASALKHSNPQIQTDNHTNPSHSTKKKFSCTECFRNFSSKQCLKEHTYMHTNEKPYLCRTCKKRFRHASQFTLHKKSHKVNSKFSWPKLTDLINTHQVESFCFFEYVEKINLPPLSGPQEFVLPSIKTVIHRLSLV